MNMQLTMQLNLFGAKRNPLNFNEQVDLIYKQEGVKFLL